MVRDMLQKYIQIFTKNILHIYGFQHMKNSFISTMSLFFGSSLSISRLSHPKMNKMCVQQEKKAKKEKKSLLLNILNTERHVIVCSINMQFYMLNANEQTYSGMIY